MSITRSYNKHNNTYYVYDTQYDWSEEKQKKVPKRTCIGKWDPESNQVIPTGSEGRLRKKVVSVRKYQPIFVIQMKKMSLTYLSCSAKLLLI